MTLVTKRQMQLCRFVRDFWTANGYGPTYAEIAKGLDIATPSAHSLVKACLSRGALVRRYGGVARSVAVSNSLVIPDATDAAPVNERSRDGLASSVR